LGADAALVWDKVLKLLSTISAERGSIRIGNTIYGAGSINTLRAGMHLVAIDADSDSPAIVLSNSNFRDRGWLNWNQRDKRLMIGASGFSCDSDPAAVEMFLWNDNLAGVILHGLNTWHVNFGFFNISAVDGSVAFGQDAHNTVQIKNISVLPTVPQVDQTGWGCKDYKPGDARMYFLGEANTNKVALTGNGLLLESALVDGSQSGITFTGAGGEVLVRGDLGYRKLDGKYWKADSNAAATMPGVALSVGVIDPGVSAEGEFLAFGFFRNDALYNLTPGSRLYASGTAGGNYRNRSIRRRRSGSGGGVCVHGRRNFLQPAAGDAGSLKPSL
jgi:hypothetical protein